MSSGAHVRCPWLQVFVAGEFMGGADIVNQMHQSGGCCWLRFWHRCCLWPPASLAVDAQHCGAQQRPTRART